MNSHPTNPIDGPTNPANPAIPPYGNPNVQVTDPPDESPEESANAIPIISEEFAARTLIQSYNVRSSFSVGLGTPHLIRSFGTRGMPEVKWSETKGCGSGQPTKNLWTKFLPFWVGCF